MSADRSVQPHAAALDESLPGDYVDEARRPILISRHRALLVEMDQGLSDPMVDGTTDHPRLQKMLAELDQPAMRQLIQETATILAQDRHFQEQTLGAALLDHLSLRRDGGSEVAALQSLAIGLYRLVRTAVKRIQGLAPTLAEIRQIPVVQLAGLLREPPLAFGSHLFPHWYAEPVRQSTLTEIRWLRQSPDVEMDTTWKDATTSTSITREDETKAAHLPEAERPAAIAAMGQHRIRSRFYRQVFLEALGPEEVDEQGRAAHRTVLAWLQDLARTPHLYPFLQGQTDGQKAFRVSQLTTKIIQLHTIYAWVSHARAHPVVGRQFAEMDTRACLVAVKRIAYPPIPADADTAFAALLAPFAGFVTFLQERVAAQDFVLPPDRPGP